MNRRAQQLQEVGASYNIGDGSDDAKVRHLEQLAHTYGVTVVGMQEGSDRRPMLAAFRARNTSWRSYSPKAPGGAAVPLAWDRTVWRRKAITSLLAVLRSWVGPKGAGPTWSKAKRVTVVVLRHRATGQRITFLVTHFIPSVTRHDLSPREHQARESNYARQARKVAAIVARSKFPVVLFTDANAGPTFPGLAPMKAAGLTGWSTFPTHDRQIFDHTPTKGLAVVDREPVTGGSDHRTVLIRFLVGVGAPRKKTHRDKGWKPAKEHR